MKTDTQNRHLSQAKPVFYPKNLRPGTRPFRTEHANASAVQTENAAVLFAASAAARPASEIKHLGKEMECRKKGEPFGTVKFSLTELAIDQFFYNQRKRTVARKHRSSEFRPEWLSQTEVKSAKASGSRITFSTIMITCLITLGGLFLGSILFGK